MFSTTDVIFIFVDILFVVFGLFRNNWVYKQRIQALTKYGVAVYDVLPSYRTMVLKFWVWDINKFIHK